MGLLDKISEMFVFVIHNVSQFLKHNYTYHMEAKILNLLFLILNQKQLVTLTKFTQYTYSRKIYLTL